MPAPRKYPQELRERAMRLVQEARREDAELSLHAAVVRVGQRTGVNADTLRGWCKQAAIDMAAAVIRKVVQGTVSGAVQDAVATAAEAAVDTTLLDELRRRAIAAAHRAIDAELAALDGDDEDVPQLYYGSLDEFVRDYLVVNYRRRVDGSRVVWAADWWAYPEATIRLDSLWHAWEQLRLDPTTGMSVWWRDHADHHMAVLLDPAGPFAGAGEGEDRVNTNEKGKPLPYTAPPEGLYPDVRDPPSSAAAPT